MRVAARDQDLQHDSDYKRRAGLSFAAVVRVRKDVNTTKLLLIHELPAHVLYGLEADFISEKSFKRPMRFAADCCVNRPSV